MPDARPAHPQLISTKQILLFEAPDPFEIVSRPSLTVTLPVTSTQRAAEVGGRCAVLAGPQGGTTVRATLPLAVDGRR